MWPNYEVVGFQASVINFLIPRLCFLLLCILPFPSWYSNNRHSYHTSSSTHLGVPCLRPSIFVCHTRSFTHLGVYRLRPSMSTTHHVLPLPSVSGSYCMPISPPILLPPLASRQSTRVAQSCFFVAYWRHHDSLLSLPPSYPVSLAHISHKGRSATHCATVACRIYM